MSTVRRAELESMTQPALCALYRQLGYIGGMHPPESWHKEEVINSILSLERVRADSACDTCRQPGTWCGRGGIVYTHAPCVCCGEPTYIRSRCGAARTAECAGNAPAAQTAPAPATRTTTARTARTKRPARPTRTRGRAADQEAATTAAIAALDAGTSLHLLTDLEDVFGPMRAGDDGRRSLPYWRPPLPGITFATSVVTGYAWARPYRGPVTVLDRSGAWVAAASSVLVAHGALTHTGPLPEFDGCPGYYQVAVYPWYESDIMPSPLGHVTSDTVWVPAPTAALLRDLVNQGRWPDVGILDSYTGDGVRLTAWTKHVNALRAHAITTYGRQSTHYAEVKIAFGQAMSLMLGTTDVDGRRVWKSRSARPDWTHHIQAQASATLWRWADDCGHVAPELPPVALRNVDELVVPEETVGILTTTMRPGGRKPMVVDESGITLGSFKIKGTEWMAA